jgi:hypothetical protein
LGAARPLLIASIAFGGNEDFEAMLDAVPLGTFKRASTSYGDLTASFIATPGTHTLKFLGPDRAGGDKGHLVTTCHSWAPSLGSTDTCPGLEIGRADALRVSRACPDVGDHRDQQCGELSQIRPRETSVGG